MVGTIHRAPVYFGVEHNILLTDFMRPQDATLDEAGNKAIGFVKNALLGNAVTERLLETESDKVVITIKRRPPQGHQSHMQPTAIEDEFVVTVKENMPGGRDHRQSFKIHKIETSEAQAQFLRFFQANIAHASRNIRERLRAQHLAFRNS